MKRKRPTMKLWIEGYSGNDIYVRIHAKEPVAYCSRCQQWEDEYCQCTNSVIACRRSVELVFGPLPTACSRTLVEFDLRTGRRVEWEPVP